MKDLLGKHAVGRVGSNPETSYISTFYQKPTIQIRETTPDGYIDDVIRVVQLINSALPYDKRISVSPVRAPHSAMLVCVGDTCRQDDYIPAGHIFVGLGPQNTWPSEERPPVLVAGVESSRDGPTSYIWINTDIVVGANQLRKVLAHELGHALGLLEHIEPHEYRTVMNTDYVNSPPVTYLPQIDTDTLYALYTRFTHEYGFRQFDPNDLGPWTDVSFHLRGDMEDVSFGASSRNGLDSALGAWPSPETNLADNQALSGSASWSGRLLGLTSESESLAGATDMTINLSTLRGQLDFTGLEHWGVNAAPGPIGSGTTWNDGDLQSTASSSGAIRSIKRVAMPERLRARSLEHGTKEWAVLSREVICPPDSEGEDNDALFRIVGPFPVFVGMRTCSSQNGLEGMRPCLWKLVRRELTDWQKNRPVPVDDWDRACRTHDDCYTKKRKTKRIMKR